MEVRVGGQWEGRGRVDESTDACRQCQNRVRYFIIFFWAMEGLQATPRVDEIGRHCYTEFLIRNQV